MFLFRFTWIYFAVSVALSIGFIVNAFQQTASSLHQSYEEHQMAVLLYIFESKIDLLIHVNTIYLLIYLFARSFMLFFIGKAMQERLVNYISTNLLFIFYILEPETLLELSLWLTWFTVIGVLRVFQIIGRERSQFLMNGMLSTSSILQQQEQQQSNSDSTTNSAARTFEQRQLDYRNKRYRLFAMFCIIAILNLFLILFGVTIFTTVDIGTTLLLLFECWILLLETISICTLYYPFLFHYQSIYIPYEENFLYTLQYFFDIILLSSNIVHYIHVWIVHGFQMSFIDISLLMLCKRDYNFLMKRIAKYRHQQQATNYLNTCLQEVTQEDVVRANGELNCPICLDTIGNQENISIQAKKLTCGHAFHKPCIKDWLKENSQCPVCRARIVQESGASH